MKKKYDNKNLTKWQLCLVFVLCCQLLWANFGICQEVYTVGEITIIKNDVYRQDEVAESSKLFKVFRKTVNSLHKQTKDFVVRRELIPQTGSILSDAELRETERNLRKLGFLTNVTITPTDTLPGNIVPLQVSIQETWSANVAFSFSVSSDDYRIGAMLSDKNLFGYGIHAGISFFEDEERSTNSLTFINRRLFGSPWRISSQFSQLSDGSNNFISFGKPFYRQNDSWSVDSALWITSYEPRYYSSNQSYMNVGVINEGCNVWAQKLVYGFNHGRLYRLGTGLRLQHIKYSDGMIIEDTSWQREQGNTVLPYLVISSEGRNWARSKLVTKYGTIEDLPLDFQFRFLFGPSPKLLGSTNDKWESELQFSNWDSVAGGFLTWSADIKAGTDYSDIQFRAGWFRHCKGNRHTRAMVELCGAENLVGNNAYRLGLSKGLRTLGYDGMTGDRLARWNLEHAIIKRDEVLGLAKIGVAGFCGGGAAWWEVNNAPKFRNEAGIGLRFAPTRSTNADVARIDMTWNLAGGSGPVITASTRGFF